MRFATGWSGMSSPSGLAARSGLDSCFEICFPCKKTSDTTTSMVGAWSKAPRSLQTFQASTTATHLFLRPPKGQNETLLGATDDYCVSSSRERAWQFLRATVAAKFPEYGARSSKGKWKSNVDTGD